MYTHLLYIYVTCFVLSYVRSCSACASQSLAVSHVLSEILPQGSSTRTKIMSDYTSDSQVSESTFVSHSLCNSSDDFSSTAAIFDQIIAQLFLLLPSRMLSSPSNKLTFIIYYYCSFSSKCLTVVLCQEKHTEPADASSALMSHKAVIQSSHLLFVVSCYRYCEVENSVIVQTKAAIE